ncbi:MAG: prephenate dehydratase [Saprospiraceae bacterium]|nr:prephenate dehydratase [Saprospiraceae bacterium]
MSLTLALEQTKTTFLAEPTRVVIQGYPGAFHEMAARLYFQHQTVEIVPADTFEDVVEMAEQTKDADLGIMAIENTVAGSLMFNYDLLQQSKLKIIGEVYLRIKQNLMVLPGVKIEDLQEVHSHYMALAQCRAYLKQYPHIKLVETKDTALSAKEIRDKQWTHIGAIASTLAAELYGLEIIGESIETNKKNFTRFLILQPSDTVLPQEGAEKVSMVFSVDHEVGSLYKVLTVLAAYNVNLTKIQSTPILGKPWEYQFFVDFVVEGKLGYQQAISAILPITHDLKIMGVYDKGIQHEW